MILSNSNPIRLKMKTKSKNWSFRWNRPILEYDDDLFWDAVGVFVESQEGFGVSMLQRRLRIGYARAARLVDLMEERGIVSPLDANKKREILIDSEQLEKLYENRKLV